MLKPASPWSHFAAFTSMKNPCDINYHKSCTYSAFFKGLDFFSRRRVICGYFEILISFLIFIFYSLIYSLNSHSKQVRFVQFFIQTYGGFSYTGHSIWNTLFIQDILKNMFGSPKCVILKCFNELYYFSLFFVLHVHLRSQMTGR